ncbi:MAG: metallophosphoesterase family protein [Candidatus Omnitrophica bacterium]|nr:metallophosphoesterase family protein [Candidatus Omnitrophota bacterium]
MKIAITADAHLRSRSDTPERYDSLKNIFEQCRKENIEKIFVLGDLFDRDFNNYHDFDELCQTYPRLQITVLPGNHDHSLKRKFFVAQNVRVIEEPHLENANHRLSFVFFPYEYESSIDEALEVFINKHEKIGRFVLLGHGDWLSSLCLKNSYEHGVYMPLSQRAIEKFSPLRVFLGHIHQVSHDIARATVVYPGSPCGLEINETGKRRFLIYDTESNGLEFREVVTPVIYFKESLLAVPVDDEFAMLRKKISDMIDGWNVKADDFQKIKLRLKVLGFTRNKEALSSFIRQVVASYGIAFYDESGPDFSELNTITDEAEIMMLLISKVQDKIYNSDYSRFHASSEDILEKAMEIIFMDKK